MGISANDNLATAKALEQQFRASLAVLPVFNLAVDHRPTAEPTTCATFMNIAELSHTQLADLRDGVAAAEALWAAIHATPFWLTKKQWPLIRCILMALSLRDTLHKCGRPDARLIRSGLDVRQIGGEFPRVLAIGDPSVPRVDSLLNAHLFVQLGDILVDPSFGQTKRPWNCSPRCAAFVVGAPAGHTIDVAPSKHAPTIMLHRYSEEGQDYQISYFKLTRKVELQTRRWRNSPDASPQRRRALVEKAVAIRLAQMADADGQEAA